MGNLSNSSRFSPRIVAGVVVVLAVVGIGSWYALRDSSTGKFSGSTAAGAAHAFELPDSGGKKHRLEDFKGSLVVLHFWASWCAPCIDEIPVWVETARKFAQMHADGKLPVPVSFVAVSLDENWPDAHKILREDKLPANLVSLLDAEKALPERYGSYQFPESYLISPDQRILMKWVGAQEWDGRSMEDFLVSAASQKPLNN